jgi:hypothetical protein
MRTFDKVLCGMGLTGVGLGVLATILNPAALTIPSKPVAAASVAQSAPQAPATPKFECKNDGTPLSPEKQAACIAWALHTDDKTPQPGLTKAQEDEIDRNDPCYRYEAPLDHMNCMLRYFRDHPSR